jgi:hypothetical protein
MIDTILIIDVEEAALGSSKELREILNGISFGRRINDAEHLLQMVLDQLILVSAGSPCGDTVRNPSSAITLICLFERYSIDSDKMNCVKYTLINARYCATLLHMHQPSMTGSNAFPTEMSLSNIVDAANTYSIE